MRRLTWFFIALGLTACATQLRRQDFERIQVGMDKDQVLEVTGNPKHSFRSNGQDHWTYVFYENNREQYRDISFRDGRVLKVGVITSKGDFNRQLESADSMEDFERAVKAHQKKTGGFEDVP